MERLSAAIDIANFLEQDVRNPLTLRHRRDRNIGAQLAASEPAKQVLHWWRVVGGDLGAPDAPSMGARVQSGRRLVSFSACLIGVAIGAGLAGAMLTQSTGHPVNLVTLFGLVVAIPTLLLAVSVLLLLPGVSGLGGVQNLLAGLSAGQWAGVWLDRWLGVSVFSFASTRSRTGRQLAKWQIVVWSQVLASGFFVGAIGATLFWVVFSDVAFGWSSTLQISTEGVVAFVQALSVPWAGWIADAVPSQELVFSSRYYRLSEQPADRVALLGSWWPFVVAVIAVYGFLPRVLLYGFGRWRLTTAEREYLLAEPAVSSLLERMRTPFVDPGAGSPVADQDAPYNPPLHRQTHALTLSGTHNLIIWNDALPMQQAQSLCRERLQVQVALAFMLDSNAARHWQPETESAAALRGTPMVVITKAWEPPLLEFNDFLARLRASVGESVMLTIVPVGIEGVPATALELEVWSSILARTRDRNVHVSQFA